MTLFIFVVVTLLFNSTYIKAVIENSPNGSFGEDTMLLQYFGESAYRNLLNGGNPFEYKSNILYPFGTPTVFGETGIFNSLFFFVFRPFLHPFASLLATAVSALFLCCITTYTLLRYLGVRKTYSTLFALVYAFAPFVSVRIQYHYNYAYHFLFSLIALLILVILRTGNVFWRIFASIGLGLTAALLFYNTLYYVVMVALFMGILAVFYCIFRPKEAFNYSFDFLVSWKYFLLALIVFAALVFPFFQQVLNVYRTEEIKQTQGWGGAIEFSANALDLFIPSEFNPFIGGLFDNLIPEKQPVEQIIYPGILALIGVGIFLWKKKENWTHPLFLTGASFYILSLGPVLHFWKYWNFHITDTILAVVPLPYVLLKQIPVLEMMRAPVRFAVMISFCFVIVAALAFEKYGDRYLKKTPYLLPVLLFVFFVDQFYLPRLKPEEINYPTRAYALIKSDPAQDFGVMEIPYVIQDGFFYWGRKFYSNPVLGELQHGKPVVGGYLARVNDYKFNYYMQDPFLGYFAYAADDERQAAGFTIPKPETSDMQTTVNFLNVKYLLVREDLPSYTSISADLQEIGYEQRLQNDNGFSLYTFQNQLRETKPIVFNMEMPSQVVFGNWSTREPTHRWVDGNYAGIFYQLESPNKTNIQFTAKAFAVPRNVGIYVNRKYAGDLTIGTEYQTFNVPALHLQKGLNAISFKFQKVDMPPKQPGQDPRNLSVAFTQFLLQ